MFNCARRGRNDRIRTCDILVPNQARYQLRYIPKVTEKRTAFLLLCARPLWRSRGAYSILDGVPCPRRWSKTVASVHSARFSSALADFTSQKRLSTVLARSPKPGALPTALHPEAFRARSRKPKLRKTVILYHSYMPLSIEVCEKSLDFRLQKNGFSENTVALAFFHTDSRVARIFRNEDHLFACRIITAQKMCFVSVPLNE